MQKINGRTVTTIDRVMQLSEAYLEDKAPMTLDNLIECLETHFDQHMKDLLILEKPFHFKEMVENSSRELFTNQADTLYNNTREFEELYSFEEFIKECSEHFALDSYELTRFEDCDPTYETDGDGNVRVNSVLDYATFCMDYCDMGYKGENDPDVAMAFFQFEKESGKGYDDLKGLWFNVVHGNVVFF